MSKLCCYSFQLFVINDQLRQSVFTCVGWQVTLLHCVIPYGKWHNIAVRWSSINNCSWNSISYITFSFTFNGMKKYWVKCYLYCLCTNKTTVIPKHYMVAQLCNQWPKQWKYSNQCKKWLTSVQNFIAYFECAVCSISGLHFDISEYLNPLL